MKILNDLEKPTFDFNNLNSSLYPEKLMSTSTKNPDSVGVKYL
jgi:hypothetical protein